MRFYYRGFHKCLGYYEIEITGNLVIATELPDNPGTSITNGAELVAQAVCEKYKIPLDKLIWIERYQERPDELDFVKFSIVNEKLVNPQWNRLKSSTVQLMIQEQELIKKGSEVHGEKESPIQYNP